MKELTLKIITMTIKIFNSTKQQTINLLTNNHINIKTISNTIIIKNNPFDIDITKLLTNNYIPFKLI